MSDEEFFLSEFEAAKRAEFEDEAERSFQRMKNNFVGACYLLAAKNDVPFIKVNMIVNSLTEDLGLDEAIRAAHELDPEFIKGEKYWLVGRMFQGRIDPPPIGRW